MITLRVKITKADFVQGTNKYGEKYEGYNCIGMELDVPEGQWQNKVPFFVKNNSVAVGDIGTLQINLDVRQYNGRDFIDAYVLNWSCTQEQAL